MTENLKAYLLRLDSDLDEYRRTLKRAFSLRFTRPKSCGCYFLELLTTTSRLYLDFLVLKRMESKIPTKLSDNAGLPDRNRGLREELAMRARLEALVESMPCWACFDPNNPFTEENGLHTQSDYKIALILHLPEIYGETINLKALIRLALADDGFSSSSRVSLLHALEHLAHHVSYSHHALELLSEEYTWIPSPLIR